MPTICGGALRTFFVNQLMALCDELEIKLRQTEADSQKLMKSVVRDLLASLNKSQEESLSVIAWALFSGVDLLS
jgi:hypothetical protein